MTLAILFSFIIGFAAAFIFIWTIRQLRSTNKNIDSSYTAPKRN